MKNILIIICLITSQIGCSQNNSLEQKVNQLVNINQVPYLPEMSGDSIYWVVIKEKIEILPFLIKKLDDTTLTNATVPNFGGNYAVADIAYHAISEIIRGIPTMDFVIKSDNPAGGYWFYWDYVRVNYDNRLTFKAQVEKWFEKNKNNLIWKEDTRNYRTAPDWKFSSNKHPAGGHYVIKE